MTDVGKELQTLVGADVGSVEQTGIILPNSSHISTDIIPEYMQGVDTGFDDLDDFIKPNRLGVIMGTTPSEDKALGPEGSIYTSQSKQIVWRPGERPVTFAPIFIWSEFICWNPRGVKDLPKMRERTNDRNSNLARKCRSFEKSDREFVCPEAGPPKPGKPPLMCVNTAHINVMVVLIDHYLQNEPMMISFSRTSYKTGENLANIIKGRKTPMCGQLWSLSASGRKNDLGEWKGFDVAPLVHHDTNLLAVAPPEWFPTLLQWREHIKQKYLDGLMVASYAEEETGEIPQSNGPTEAEIVEAANRY